MSRTDKHVPIQVAYPELFPDDIVEVNTTNANLEHCVPITFRNEINYTRGPKSVRNFMLESINRAKKFEPHEDGSLSNVGIFNVISAPLGTLTEVHRAEQHGLTMAYRPDAPKHHQITANTDANYKKYVLKTNEPVNVKHLKIIDQKVFIIDNEMDPYAQEQLHEKALEAFSKALHGKQTHPLVDKEANNGVTPIYVPFRVNNEDYALIISKEWFGDVLPDNEIGTSYLIIHGELRIDKPNVPYYVNGWDYSQWVEANKHYSRHRDTWTDVDKAKERQHTHGTLQDIVKSVNSGVDPLDIDTDF